MLCHLVRLKRVSKLNEVEMMMAQSAKFWDRIAKRYAKMSIPDEVAYKKKLQITRSYFRPEMEVLEFGCGTGSTAIAHAPYVKHILAIDFSTKMIEIARAKADAAKVRNVTFQQGAIESLNASERSFDAVMGHSVLHLVEDRDAVIARVHDLLKPGGVFIASTACLGDSMLKHIRIVAPLGRFLGLLPMLKVFTTQQFLDSLISAGFEIDHQWQPGKAKALFIVAKKEG